MLNTIEKKTDKNYWFIKDWPEIRKTIITSAIINFFVGVYIVFKMYENQKLIMYRLDKIEANQEAINSEIINLYKYEQR